MVRRHASPEHVAPAGDPGGWSTLSNSQNGGCPPFPRFLREGGPGTPRLAFETWEFR